MNKLLSTLWLLSLSFYLSAQTVQIGGTNYGSISAAISAATDGDVIDITGTHTESLSFNNKSLTLRGADPTTDIIQAAASAGTASDRVITIFEPAAPINVTIENLTIRYGNISGSNGGGINVEKNTGTVTLQNVIITDNATTNNGGGLNAAGSNITVIECTLQNNTSTLDGGSMAVAPNNGVTDDTDVQVQRSLIEGNTGRNGGGIYVNGNQGSGNDNLLNVTIENTIIANNSTTSASGGNGGGGIWSRGATYTGTDGGGNTTLQLVHVTFYNNTHASTTKNGISFNGADVTNFSAYNSIIISASDNTESAINFNNTNTTAVINCQLGGLSNTPTLVTESANNNTIDQTDSDVGIATTLSDEGGNIQVLATQSASPAIDYCSASTGITLPSDDAVNNTRDSTPDAGAYEYDGPRATLSGTVYFTVSEAVTAASDSDVIEISGTHTETISVNKSITLQGTDPTTDILQAATSAGTASDRVLNMSANGTSRSITIENLGIRYGNTTANGGGILIDKNPGLVTLNNLIIEDNATTANGGGISVAGSNVDMTEITLQNNSATSSGGGMIVAPNNSVADDTDIQIFRSLINANTAADGGGMYINGNPTFGNDNLINVYIENTTVTGNSATSVSTEPGGGAIWSRGAVWTGDGVTGNTTLTLVHTTFYSNSHTSAARNGIRFTNAGADVNFSLYNSIIVNENTTSERAIDFANVNTTEAINNILGGLNSAPTSLLDDAGKNNSRGRTATFAGIATTLTDEGGKVQVLTIGASENATDFCTAATGITLPAVDAVGTTRDASPDAGAFEYITGALPVELLYFQGNFEASQVRLLWETATELNNDRFEIERSRDGHDFHLLGTVAGNGTTSKNIQYRYQDRSPGPGINYYRLKQVDYDGAFEYSKVMAIATLSPDYARTVLYPNPTTFDNINLLLEGTEAQTTLEVQIMDSFGRAVWSNAVPMEAGQVKLNVEEPLAEGIYFLQLQSPVKQETLQLRISGQ